MQNFSKIPLNITQIAWLGHQNYGDDMMSFAIRNYLSKNNKFLIKYTIWSDKKPPPSKDTGWIYPFDPKVQFVKKIFQKITLKKTDILLIGGGSILHSSRSIKWKMEAVSYLKKVNPMAKSIGICLSIGPFDSEIAKIYCSEFLKILNGASFRDQESYDFAKSLNLPYEPILAFDLAGNYLEAVNILPKEESSYVETIGLAIRKPFSSKSDETTKHYIKLIRQIKSQGKKVLLFFFSTEDLDKEKTFIEILKKETNISEKELVIYNGNLKEFTEKIKSCDFFVSTRFHGLVIPFLLNIPFISIRYESMSDKKKFDDFAKYIKLPKKYQLNENDISAEKILKEITPRKPDSAENFYILSRRNFDLFNSLSDKKR